MLYDVLSIWEIAHRWHGYDPNISDPKKLPLDVQDKLRFLTRRMAYHDLATCSPRGAVYQNDSDIETLEEIISYQVDPDSLSGGERQTIYENYLDHMDIKTRRHNEIIEGFELCFEQRVYDKSKLDHVYTTQYELAKLCAEFEISLPDFWYPKNWNSGLNAENDDYENLKPNQLDKQLCQAIAGTLWHESPDLNIQQIITHPALQRFGNGAHYTERTLRGWVKELDPRPEDKRTGRPKKS